MASPRVFISHASSDAEFAAWLSGQLRQFGADVWLDSTHMGSGDFVIRLNKALEACNFVILVLSHAAIKSKWVQQEFNSTIVRVNRGVMHAPIIIVAQPFRPSQIPPLWDVYHRYDATQDYTRALRDVAQELNLTVPPTSRILPPPLPSRRGETRGRASLTDFGVQPPVDWTPEILKPLQKHLHMNYPVIAITGMIGAISEIILGIYLIQASAAFFSSFTLPDSSIVPYWLLISASICGTTLPYVGFILALVEMRRRRSRWFTFVLLMNIFTSGLLFGSITAVLYGFWGSRQMR